MNRFIAIFAAGSLFFSSTVAAAGATPPTTPSPTPPPELSLNLDLRITGLEEGAVAPFSGILITPDSMTKMEYDHALRLSLLQAEHKFSLEGIQLRLNTAESLRQSEKEMYETILDSRLIRIQELEKIATSRRPDWVMPVAILGAFLVGAGVTVGVTYAVNQP